MLVLVMVTIACDDDKQLLIFTWQVPCGYKLAAIELVSLSPSWVWCLGGVGKVSTFIPRGGRPPQRRGYDKKVPWKNQELCSMSTFQFEKVLARKNLLE